MDSTPAPIDAAAADHVFRKIGMRLIPILGLGYFVNYLDRTNIGFAALTMNSALGLTATEFGLGAGLLFIGYSVFEIPSNLALYHFGARRWIARILISWGLISAGMAFVTGPRSYYAMRLALGIAEAGFFPGVTFYLAMWFPAQYRARFFAWFLLAIPVSFLLGGPLGGFLLELDGALGVAGWQWLFLVEGIPAVIVGILVLRILADRPSDAAWLTAEEKRIATAVLEAEKRDRPHAHLWAALRDPRVLILALVQFGFTLGSYGVGIFLPQIIKGYGSSNLIVGLISAIPYIFASLAMLAWAAHVDRSGRKIFNLAVACALSAAGLVFAIVSGSLIVALIGLTIALVGVTSARAIFWTIPTRFLTGLAAAGGLAFINSIGTLGGFAGPYMMGWLKDFTGSFTAGLLAMAGLLVVTTLLTVSLKLLVRQE